MFGRKPKPKKSRVNASDTASSIDAATLLHTNVASSSSAGANGNSSMRLPLSLDASLDLDINPSTSEPKPAVVKFDTQLLVSYLVRFTNALQEDSGRVPANFNQADIDKLKGIRKCLMNRFSIPRMDSERRQAYFQWFSRFDAIIESTPSLLMSPVTKYQLCPYSDLPKEDPKPGIIYLDVPTGTYTLLGLDRKVKKGTLEGIDVRDLSSIPESHNFKRHVLMETASKGYTQALDPEEGKIYCEKRGARLICQLSATNTVELDIKVDGDLTPAVLAQHKTKIIAELTNRGYIEDKWADIELWQHTLERDGRRNRGNVDLAFQTALLQINDASFTDIKKLNRAKDEFLYYLKEFKKLNKNKYNLHLITALPGNDRDQAIAGNIYIDVDAKSYIFRGVDGQIKEGSLADLNIDIKPDSLDDLSFKAEVLQVISNDEFTLHLMSELHDNDEHQIAAGSVYIDADTQHYIFRGLDEQIIRGSLASLDLDISRENLSDKDIKAQVLQAISKDKLRAWYAAFTEVAEEKPVHELSSWTTHIGGWPKSLVAAWVRDTLALADDIELNTRDANQQFLDIDGVYSVDDGSFDPDFFVLLHPILEGDAVDTSVMDTEDLSASPELKVTRNEIICNALALAIAQDIGAHVFPYMDIEPSGSSEKDNPIEIFNFFIDAILFKIISNGFLSGSSNFPLSENHPLIKQLQEIVKKIKIASDDKKASGEDGSLTQQDILAIIGDTKFKKINDDVIISKEKTLQLKLVENDFLDLLFYLVNKKIISVQVRDLLTLFDLSLKNNEFDEGNIAELDAIFSKFGEADETKSFAAIHLELKIRGNQLQVYLMNRLLTALKKILKQQFTYSISDDEPKESKQQESEEDSDVEISPTTTLTKQRVDEVSAPDGEWVEVPCWFVHGQSESARKLLSLSLLQNKQDTFRPLSFMADFLPEYKPAYGNVQNNDLEGFKRNYECIFNADGYKLVFVNDLPEKPDPGIVYVKRQINKFMPNRLIYRVVDPDLNPNNNIVNGYFQGELSHINDDASLQANKLNLLRQTYERGHTKVATFQSYNLLHMAVIYNRIDMVSFLLSQANTYRLLFEKTSYVFAGKEYTALHLAVIHGSLAMVQLLLDHGADIYDLAASNRKEGGSSVLHLAVMHGRTDIVEYLLNKYPKLRDATTEDGYPILHLAVIHGRSDIVSLLCSPNDTERSFNINSGGGEEQLPALSLAIKLGRIDIFNQLLALGANCLQTSNNGYNALHWAIKFGYDAIANRLLEIEAVRADMLKDFSVINTAITYGKTELALQLLAMRSTRSGEGDLPISYTTTSTRLDREPTPLYTAILNNDIRIVSALIDMGADCTELVLGNTLLQFAIANGASLEIIKRLVETKKFDINAVNLTFTTPLMRAICFHNIKRKKDEDEESFIRREEEQKNKIVECLLENGADFNINENATIYKTLSDTEIDQHAENAKFRQQIQKEVWRCLFRDNSAYILTMLLDHNIDMGFNGSALKVIENSLFEMTYHENTLAALKRYLNRNQQYWVNHPFYQKVLSEAQGQAFTVGLEEVSLFQEVVNQTILEHLLSGCLDAMEGEKFSRFLNDYSGNMSLAIKEISQWMSQQRIHLSPVLLTDNPVTEASRQALFNLISERTDAQQTDRNIAKQALIERSKVKQEEIKRLKAHGLSIKDYTKVSSILQEPTFRQVDRLSDFENQSNVAILEYLLRGGIDKADQDGQFSDILQHFESLGYTIEETVKILSSRLKSFDVCLNPALLMSARFSQENRDVLFRLLSSMALPQPTEAQVFQVQAMITKNALDQQFIKINTYQDKNSFFHATLINIIHAGLNNAIEPDSLLWRNTLNLLRTLRDKKLIDFNPEDENNPETMMKALLYCFGGYGEQKFTSDAGAREQPSETLINNCHWVSLQQACTPYLEKLVQESHDAADHEPLTLLKAANILGCQVQFVDMDSGTLSPAAGPKDAPTFYYEPTQDGHFKARLHAGGHAQQIQQACAKPYDPRVNLSKVDLRENPGHVNKTPDHGKDHVVAKGDAHGNPVNMLHFLIYEGIVTFKPEEGQKDPYVDFAERYAALPVDKTHNQDDIKEMTEIIAQLQLGEDHRKLAIFIGDTLFDRGKNDKLQIALYKRLHELGINYQTPFSNHDAGIHELRERVKAREGKVGDSAFFSGQYDIRLMSKLRDNPDKIPKHGKLYVEKQGNQLHYVVLQADGHLAHGTMPSRLSEEELAQLSLASIAKQERREASQSRQRKRAILDSVNANGHAYGLLPEHKRDWDTSEGRAIDASNFQLEPLESIPSGGQTLSSKHYREAGLDAFLADTANFDDIYGAHNTLISYTWDENTGILDLYPHARISYDAIESLATLLGVKRDYVFDPESPVALMDLIDRINASFVKNRGWVIRKYIEEAEITARETAEAINALGNGATQEERALARRDNREHYFPERFPFSTLAWTRIVNEGAPGQDDINGTVRDKLMAVPLNRPGMEYKVRCTAGHDGTAGSVYADANRETGSTFIESSCINPPLGKLSTRSTTIQSEYIGEIGTTFPTHFHRASFTLTPKPEDILLLEEPKIQAPHPDVAQELEEALRISALPVADSSPSEEPASMEIESSEVKPKTLRQRLQEIFNDFFRRPTEPEAMAIEPDSSGSHSVSLVSESHTTDPASTSLATASPIATATSTGTANVDGTSVLENDPIIVPTNTHSNTLLNPTVSSVNPNATSSLLTAATGVQSSAATFSPKTAVVDVHSMEMDEDGILSSDGSDTRKRSREDEALTQQKRPNKSSPTSISHNTSSLFGTHEYEPSAKIRVSTREQMLMSVKAYTHGKPKQLVQDQENVQPSQQETLHQPPLSKASSVSKTQSTLTAPLQEVKVGTMQQAGQEVWRATGGDLISRTRALATRAKQDDSQRMDVVPDDTSFVSVRKITGNILEAPAARLTLCVSLLLREKVLPVMEQAHWEKVFSHLMSTANKSQAEINQDRATLETLRTMLDDMKQIPLGDKRRYQADFFARNSFCQDVAKTPVAATEAFETVIQRITEESQHHLVATM